MRGLVALVAMLVVFGIFIVVVSLGIVIVQFHDTVKLPAWLFTVIVSLSGASAVLCNKALKSVREDSR